MEHLDQDRRRHLHLVVRSGQSDQRGQSHPADTDANAVLHMAAMALFIPDDVGCGGVRGQVQHTLTEWSLSSAPTPPEVRINPNPLDSASDRTSVITGSSSGITGPDVTL